MMCEGSATVGQVHPFLGLYHQAGRGITSEEVCSVDITVVSFCLEELLVIFVCFMPRSLFLLLFSPCRPVVTRWCIEVSRVFAPGLDDAQRWKSVSEFCCVPTLARESEAHLP